MKKELVVSICFTLLSGCGSGSDNDTVTENTENASETTVSDRGLASGDLLYRLEHGFEGGGQTFDFDRLWCDTLQLKDGKIFMNDRSKDLSTLETCDQEVVQVGGYEFNNDVYELSYNGFDGVIKLYNVEDNGEEVNAIFEEGNSSQSVVYYRDPEEVENLLNQL